MATTTAEEAVIGLAETTAAHLGNPVTEPEVEEEEMTGITHMHNHCNSAHDRLVKAAEAAEAVVVAEVVAAEKAMNTKSLVEPDPRSKSS